jgi:urease accessory protein
MTTIMKLKEPERRQSPHLSPAGRGRPRKTRAGEGDQSQIDSASSPHPNPLPAGERERAELTAAALYRLLAWMSPAYPVGAFSYSGGIEWAVEAGDIEDAETLREWLAVVIGEGCGFADAVLFSHAHDAITTSDDAALRAVAELAAALVPSKERLLETTAQGRAFLDTTQAAWPTPALARLEAVWNGPIALPVAVGAACAGHGIARGPALRAFLQALAANWISAGIRLIPLGQTDGQHILAAVETAVAESAARAQTTPLDELGTCALRADIAGMKHETQYTRLFRS